MKAVQGLREYMLFGVRKLCSLLVIRKKGNTKLILGRFKCEGVDSIRFVRVGTFFVIR